MDNDFLLDLKILFIIQIDIGNCACVIVRMNVLL